MRALCVVLVGLSVGLLRPDGAMCEDGNKCFLESDGGYRCPLSPRRVGAVICPDQESECPDDTTCCQLPDGSWGCCPFPKAVCCEDERHCCPEGTSCDLVHSKCVSPSLQSFPMLKKLPATREGLQPAAASVVCPGGKSSCPSSFTCCLLTSGDYGCCPYPEATCCSDHLHCCPGNSTCDLELGVCKSGEASVEPIRKIFALPEDVMCPDQKTVCPDGSTCCQLDTGTFGCCPMPNAVCCSDHIHCCPAGTTCDLVHSTCAAASEGAAESVMMPLSVVRQKTDRLKGLAVPCNASVACADGNTCCRSSKGQWACCPLPEAVCCKDHLHCCPHGTVCNLAASTCDDPSGSAVTPLLSNTRVFPYQSKNSKCDESASCPGDATCCRTEAGGWACCPLPQAVCCDDHIHCCPNATVCNLETETCDDPSGLSPSLPWLTKRPRLTSEMKEEKCDADTVCPGRTTCCKESSGRWACCPLPQAVCCSDLQHCCPKGYKCNVSEQTCERPGGPSLPWQQKLPAVRQRSGQTGNDENKCDAQTSCPRDTTCCFMEQSHQWGCCPLPQAVCCEDGNHCCPRGHTCQPHRSSCSRGPHVLPWFTKVRALTEPSGVADIKCDDKSSCASGTTCCPLKTGGWGCCPLVKAVCCADHEHCCPQGYTCNMQTGTCEKKAGQSLPLTPVVLSNLNDSEDPRDVPCDGMGEFKCPKQDTCCRISATEWGCCPSPGAVCCMDSKRCCPAGSSCDLKTGGCTLEPRLTWDTSIGGKRTDFVPQGL
ncbi:granulin b [Oryzias melastigma]|uniref:Granulin b n=1 Tax=Oryzias melastigma TaxID=30732 RepID=A0A3B3B7Z3_ORYME|nr:granulin b [Oryzias melastigma]